MTLNRKLKQKIIAVSCIFSLVIGGFLASSLLPKVPVKRANAYEFGLKTPSPQGGLKALSGLELIKPTIIDAKVSKTISTSHLNQIDFSKYKNQESLFVQIVLNNVDENGFLEIQGQKFAYSPTNLSFSTLLKLEDGEKITVKTTTTVKLSIFANGFFDIGKGANASVSGTKVITSLNIYTLNAQNNPNGGYLYQNQLHIPVLGRGEIPQRRKDHSGEVKAVWAQVFESGYQLKMIAVNSDGELILDDYQNIKSITAVGYVENVSQKDASQIISGGQILAPKHAEIKISDQKQKYSLKDVVHNKNIEQAVLQIETKKTPEEKTPEDSSKTNSSGKFEQIQFARSDAEKDTGRWTGVNVVDDRQITTLPVELNNDGEFVVEKPEDVQIKSMTVLSYGVKLNGNSQTAESKSNPTVSFTQVNGGETVDLAKTPEVELSGEVTTENGVNNVIVSYKGDLVAVADIDTTVYPYRWSTKVAAGEGTSRLEVMAVDANGDNGFESQTVNAKAPDQSVPVLSDDTVHITGAAQARITQFYKDTITFSGNEPILTPELDSSGNQVYDLVTGNKAIHLLKAGDVIVGDDKNPETPQGFMARVVSITPMLSKTVVGIVRVFYDQAIIQADEDKKEEVVAKVSPEELKELKAEPQIDIPTLENKTPQPTQSMKQMGAMNARNMFINPQSADSNNPQKPVVFGMGNNTDLASADDIDAVNEKWMMKQCDPHGIGISDVTDAINSVTGSSIPLSGGTFGLGGSLCSTKHEKMLCPTLNLEGTGHSPKCPLDNIYDNSVNGKQNTDTDKGKSPFTSLPEEKPDYADGAKNKNSGFDDAKTKKEGDRKQLRTKIDGDASAFAEIALGPVIEFRLSIGIKWKWGFIPIPTLKHFKTSFFFGFSAKAGIYIDGGASVSFRERLLKLARGQLPPITFTIVVIPVILQPDLEVIAMITGTVDGKFIARAESTHGWEYGIEYTPEEGWRKIAEKQDVDESSMTMNVALKVTLQLQIKFGIYLYDVMGPYAKANFNIIQASLSIGLRGVVSGNGGVQHTNLKLSLEIKTNIEAFAGLEIRLGFFEKKIEFPLFHVDIWDYKKDWGAKCLDECTVPDIGDDGSVKKAVSGPGTLFMFNPQIDDDIKLVPGLKKIKKVVGSKTDDISDSYAIDIRDDLWLIPHDLTSQKPQKVLDGVKDVSVTNMMISAVTYSGNVYVWGKINGSEYQTPYKLDITDAKLIDINNGVIAIVRNDNTIWTATDKDLTLKLIKSFDPKATQSITQVMLSENKILVISQDDNNVRDGVFQGILDNGTLSDDGFKKMTKDSDIGTDDTIIKIALTQKANAEQIYFLTNNGEVWQNKKKIDLVNSLKVTDMKTTRNKLIFLTGDGSIIYTGQDNLTHLLSKYKDISEVGLNDLGDNFITRVSTTVIDKTGYSGNYDEDQKYFTQYDEKESQKVLSTKNETIQLDENGSVWVFPTDQKSKVKKLTTPVSGDIIQNAADISVDDENLYVLLSVGIVYKYSFDGDDANPEEYTYKIPYNKCGNPQNINSTNSAVLITCENGDYFKTKPNGDLINQESLGKAKQIVTNQDREYVLKEDGKIEGLNDQNNNNIEKLFLAKNSLFAKKENGEIYYLNNTENLVLAINYQKLDVKDIVSDMNSVFALTTNSIVLNMGDDGLKYPEVIEQNVDVIKLFNGFNTLNSLHGGFEKPDIETDSGYLEGDGNNDYGQLGINGTISQDNFVNSIAMHDQKVKQVASGDKATYVLKEDKTVWAFGDNSSGQLGIGSTTNEHDTSVQVHNLKDIQKVVASKNSALALDSDGFVYGWGANEFGQLGTGSKYSEFTPRRLNIDGVIDIEMVGDLAYAVRANQTVLVWGKYFGEEILSPKTVLELQNVQNVQIFENKEGKTQVDAIIKGQLCEIIQKGDLRCLDISTGSSAKIKQLFVINKEVFVLDSDNNLGKVDGESVDYLNIHNVKKVQQYNRDALILTTNGEFYRYGEKEDLIKEDNLNGVLDITTNQKEENASAFIITKVQTDEKPQGSVYAMGQNNLSQLGFGNESQNGVNFDKLKMVSNTVIAASQNDRVGKDGGALIANKIVSKYGSSFAITNEGTVYGWGSNQNNRLGFGDYELSLAEISGNIWTRPTKNRYLIDIVDIAIGKNAVYALDKYGEVFAWGSNEKGALGNNDPQIEEASIPKIVYGLTYVSQIAANETSAYALREDGTVYGWGSNEKGALGIGKEADFWTAKPLKINSLQGVKQISASSNYVLTLRNNGEVWAFGDDNQSGRLGTGCQLGIVNQPVRSMVDINNCTDLKAVDGKFQGKNVQWTAVLSGDNGGYAKMSNGDTYRFGVDGIDRKLSYQFTKQMVEDGQNFYNLTTGNFVYKGSNPVNLPNDNKPLGIFRSDMGIFTIMSEENASSDEEAQQTDDSKTFGVYQFNHDEHSSVQEVSAKEGVNLEGQTAIQIVVGKNYATAILQNGKVLIWNIADNKQADFLNIPENVQIKTLSVCQRNGVDYFVMLSVDGSVYQTVNNDGEIKVVEKYRPSENEDNLQAIAVAGVNDGFYIEMQNKTTLFKGGVESQEHLQKVNIPYQDQEKIEKLHKAKDSNILYLSTTNSRVMKIIDGVVSVDSSISDDLEVSQIVNTANYIYALDTAGKVWTMGHSTTNSKGQRGIGFEEAPLNAATLVRGDLNDRGTQGVTGNDDYALAISDDKVYQWGNNVSTPIEDESLSAYKWTQLDASLSGNVFGIATEKKVQNSEDEKPSGSSDVGDGSVDGFAEGINILSNTEFLAGQRLDLSVLAKGEFSYQPDKLDIELLSSTSGKTLRDINPEILESFTYREDTDQEPSDITKSQFEIASASLLGSDFIGDYNFKLTASYSYKNPQSFNSGVIESVFTKNVQVKISRPIEPYIVGSSRIDLTVGQCLDQDLKIASLPAADVFPETETIPSWMSFTSGNYNRGPFHLGSVGITPDLLNGETEAVYYVKLIAKTAVGKDKQLIYEVHLHGSKPEVNYQDNQVFANGEQMELDLGITGNPAPKVELLGVDGNENETFLMLDDGVHNQGPYILFSPQALNDSEVGDHIAKVKISNDYGEQIKEVHFTVANKPSFKIQGLQTFYQGQSSVLELNIHGDPKPNLEVVKCPEGSLNNWLSYNQNQLIINNLAPVGTHHITLKATNSAGSTEETVLIKVIDGNPYIDLLPRYSFSKGSHFDIGFDVATNNQSELQINNTPDFVHFEKLSENGQGSQHYHMFGNVPSDFEDAGFDLSISTTTKHIELYGVGLDAAFHLNGDRAVSVNNYLYLDLGITGIPCPKVSVEQGYFLPEGLELMKVSRGDLSCDNYVVEGIAKKAGVYAVEFDAISNGKVTQNAVEFNIDNEKPAFHPVGNSTYQKGDGVHINLNITGSDKPEVRVSANSVLPDGVGIHRTFTGNYALRGVAQESGHFEFDLELYQSSNVKASKHFILDILDKKEAPRFNLQPVNTITQGDFASAYLGVIGSPCPTVKVKNPEALAKSGLRLQGQCGSDKGYHLGGTAANPGIYDLVIEASNSFGKTETHLNLVVAPRQESPQLHILDIPVAQTGYSFALPLNITGYPDPKVIVSPEEQLPKGLTLKQFTFPYNYAITGVTDSSIPSKVYHLKLIASNAYVTKILPLDIEVVNISNNNLLASQNLGMNNLGYQTADLPPTLEGKMNVTKDANVLVGKTTWIVDKNRFVEIPVHLNQVGCSQVSLRKNSHLPKGLKLEGSCHSNFMRYYIRGNTNKAKKGRYTVLLNLKQQKTVALLLVVR